MLAALKDNNLAKFCSYMTDPGGCLGGMAMAKAFLGSGKVADLLGPSALKKAEKEIDTAPIHVSQDGTRATIEWGKGQPDKWVKVDGDWKTVYTSN